MSDNTSGNVVIHAAALKKALHDGQEIALLDVREQGQFGERHLFYAIPLPYSRLEAEIERLVPRKNVRIVLVDEQDMTIALKSMQRLQAMGYSDISILEQGMAGWEAAGLETFAGVNVPSKTFGELAEHAFHTPHISARALHESMARGDDLIVVDGRPYQEFQKMSIPGAVSCPNGELALWIDEFVPSPTTTVVMNCAGRTRSIVGAQTLIHLGIPNQVFALENGTQGWYLENFELDHGASSQYPAPPGSEKLAKKQARTLDLATRHALRFADAATVQALLSDSARTTYLCDVRSPEEFACGSLAGAQSTPGGQLIQATDQYVAVRGARIVVFDSENVRAAVVASWLQMLGWEVVVLNDALSQASLFKPRAPVSVREPSTRISAAQLAVLKNLGALIVDVRPSMQFRTSHINGARWSIRPALVALMAAEQTNIESIVLVANEQSVAALAEQELSECFAGKIYCCLEGPSYWSAAGLTVDRTADFPPDEACIDYLFFVHDRHDGNRAAALQYLAWETNLLSQVDAQERSGFRLP